MTASSPAEALCSHCLLPLGRRPMRRLLNGEDRAFCCYGCCIAYQVKAGSGEESEAAWLLIRLGVGGFLSMNIMLFSLLFYTDALSGADARIVPGIDLLLWFLATPVLVILGGPFFRESWQGLLRGRPPASTLIALGVGAAYGYSVLGVLQHGTHIYFDTATMVLMFFTLGRYLDAVGRARAARDLSPLLAAESEWAVVLEDGAERRRPVREVVAGMLVRAKPSERIAVDGIVVEGESHVDEAVMTGESRQVAKGPGTAVIAGSINLDGPLVIRSSGAGSETRWAQICRSVREALLRRSPTQRIADQVAGVFVPVVLTLAAGAVLYWAHHGPFDKALLAGLAVLVVACPCAVGLAAPLATSLGIGRLARHGCIVRSPGALEALARISLLAFDKTGTLTSGHARLVAVESDGASSDEVLARAAGLEFHSEHSLARAIIAASVARGLRPSAVEDVRVLPGRGLRGRSQGQPVAAGTAKLMRELDWPLSPRLRERARALETSGHSVVLVGWGERVYAVLALDDTPLAEARSTVEAARRMGIQVALLTGDLPEAARRVARAVGIDEVEAGLSPEAKRASLERRRRSQGVVAMVGDGLNDGPVLASADVGIAVGSATDLARETAELVLPAEGLWLLPWILVMARAVRATIRTNLAWAFGYNFIALSLAACGLLQPILAAGIMAGSSLLVVLNSLRLERLPGPLPATAMQAGESLLSEQARSVREIAILPISRAVLDA
jgi:Cu2+-exporting ATPase